MKPANDYVPLPEFSVDAILQVFLQVFHHISVIRLQLLLLSVFYTVFRFHRFHSVTAVWFVRSSISFRINSMLKSIQT